MNTGSAILQSLPEIAGLIITVAVLLLSLWLAANGVWVLYQSSAGNPQSSAWFGLLSVLLGGFLLNYGGFMSAMFETVTGTSGLTSYSQLSYSPPGAVGMPAWVQEVIDACVNVIQVFGWMAGISGIMDWRKAAEGRNGSGGFDDPAWTGTLKVFGGSMAINAPTAIAAVMGFLGISGAAG